ncbi:MAG: hypothetical protein NVSMB68_15920 [Thermoanaerobaculia bacterium]
MTASPTPLPSFGHYEVERVLGRGAMGTVYLARDSRIGRRVALKTIAISQRQLDDSTSPAEFHQRLQREAELSGSLSHPNIVALYEAGYQDERISYLAMEYVEGKTLAATIKSIAPAPLDLDTTARIIEDVLRGLAHAHAAGIIHRDIKPANILITGEGVAKIADFGIARPQNSSLTAAGALMGTPNNRSPEQVLRHPLTPTADVFSAGVMLFEMLTAVKPFAGNDLTSTLHNILRAEVPYASDVNPAVPRNLSDAIARMVAKDPDWRPTAEEAAGSIRRTDAPIVRTPAESERHRPVGILIAAAATLIVIIAISAIVLATRREEPAVQITPAKLEEFDEKRRALDRAETALHAGQYQEALDLYNSYLAKYPASEVAVSGRDRALEALAKPAEEVTPAKRKRHRRSRDEDISPAELLRRIKKALKH